MGNKLIGMLLLLAVSISSQGIGLTPYEDDLFDDLKCISDKVATGSVDASCDNIPTTGKDVYEAQGALLPAIPLLYVEVEDVKVEVKFPDGTEAYNKDKCSSRSAVSGDDINIKTADKWDLSCREFSAAGYKVSSYSASGSSSGSLKLTPLQTGYVVEPEFKRIQEPNNYTYYYDPAVLGDLENTNSGIVCSIIEFYSELPHTKTVGGATNFYFTNGQDGGRGLCVRSANTKEFYTQTVASEVCDGVSITSDNKVNYECDISTRLEGYLGEEVLVPIQVGDITTFIPAIAIDSQISNEVVADMSGSNIGKQTPAPEGGELKVTCGENTLVSNSYNQSATLTRSFDVDTDEDSSDGRSLSQECYAANTGENVGESLAFESTYVNSSGSPLQPESIDWTIFYERSVDADNSWSDAELYLNAELVKKMAPIQYLLANLNVSLTNEVTQEQMECELSNALYEAIPFENQYLDEFYVNGNGNIPQTCIDSDGSRAVYWMYINDPLSSSIARLDDMPVSSLIDAIDYFANAPAAYSAYIGMITDDLVAYLEGPVTSFMGLANEYSDTLQLQTCSNLSSALAAMVTQITNTEYDSSEIVINSCQ